MPNKIIYRNKLLRTGEYISMIWNYRYLIHSLSSGDVKNRFAGTYLGILLSIVQTLVGLAVYWLVFGIALHVDTGGIAYPVFALPGLVIWQYFSNTTAMAAGSLFYSRDLINKHYFPRISFVISNSFSAMVDMISGILVLCVLMLAFSVPATWQIALLVPLMAILWLICLAISMWVSIVSLYIRDVGNIIVQLTGFLIFVTPVFYPATIIPEHLKIIMHINPVAGVIEYFRAFLFANSMPENAYLIGFGLALVLLVSGFYVYKRLEKNISDLL